MRAFVSFASLFFLTLASNGEARVATVDRSADEACEIARQVVAENGDYKSSDIVGCDGAVETEQVGGEHFYVLRLNGQCRQEVCGSVLLGWFAVSISTGSVYDWNVADWKLGEMVTPDD